MLLEPFYRAGTVDTLGGSDVYGYIGKHGQGKGREVVDPNPSLFGIHIDIGTGRDKAGDACVYVCVGGWVMK